MLELREWARQASLSDRPWLILGKGPTIDRRDDFDLGAYNLLSLNHALRLAHVDVAHIVDVDVVVDCADVIEQQCRWVVMPRHPHVANRAGRALLEDFVEHIPVLDRLDRAGRLVWYNAATAEPVGDSPTMSLRYFSSEAALDILGEIGAREVHSLGVDGGTAYGAGFDYRTLLANGQPTFDVQFAELRRIATKRQLDYRPLLPPMRVFVGVDASQVVAARVLEHSIRTHASRPVVVEHLNQPPARLPKDPQNQPRTAFSFNRFRIPELAGYSGRALYLDADMLVFGDVAELFDLPFAGATVLCSRQDEPPTAWVDHTAFHPGRQFSVMMIDCEEAKWRVDDVVEQLDAGAMTYEELMFDLAVVDPTEIGETVPVEWNHLEQYVDGRTKLLHYTVVPTQPWKDANNPLGHLWERAYEAAVADGAVPPDEVAASVVRRWVRRDLARAPFVQPVAPSAPVPRNASPAEVELAALRAWVDKRRTGRSLVAKSLRDPKRAADVVRRWLTRTLAGVRRRRVRTASDSRR